MCDIINSINNSNLYLFFRFFKYFFFLLKTKEMCFNLLIVNILTFNFFLFAQTTFSSIYFLFGISIRNEWLNYDYFKRKPEEKQIIKRKRLEEFHRVYFELKYLPCRFNICNFFTIKRIKELKMIFEIANRPFILFYHFILKVHRCPEILNDRELKNKISVWLWWNCHFIDGIYFSTEIND